MGVNSVPSTVSPCSTHCLPVVSGPKCVCVCVRACVRACVCMCVYPTSPVCSVLWLRCTHLRGSVGLEVWGDVIQFVSIANHCLHKSKK